MKPTLNGIERRLDNLEASARGVQLKPTRETILSIALDSRLTNEQAAKQIGSIGGRVLSASVARIRELFALARQRKEAYEAHIF